MINRENFAEEMKLRGTVRRAIQLIKERRVSQQKQSKSEEKQLRALIGELLQEAQAAVTTTAKHANTGINVLEDLLKKMILSLLSQYHK